MKKVIFFLFVLKINAFSQAIDKSKVPKNILKAFEAKYPNTRIKKWEFERGKYEAEFNYKKCETSVLFNKLGNIIETETRISIAQLPKKAVEYLVKNTSGSKIIELSLITDYNGRKKYEAEVGSKNYFFDEFGNLLK